MAYDITGIPFSQAPNVVLSTGTFQTFCIEYTEEFNPGQLLYADVNTGARFGGAAGGMDDPNHSGETWDPLDDRTAYLYTQFSQHTLSNYNYDYGSDRSASGVNFKRQSGISKTKSHLLERETSRLKHGSMKQTQPLL